MKKRNEEKRVWRKKEEKWENKMRLKRKTKLNELDTDKYQIVCWGNTTFLKVKMHNIPYNVL